MSKQLLKPLFFLLISAALFLLAIHALKPANAVVYEKELPVTVESAGTQLLWESLSHQFLTSVQ